MSNKPKNTVAPQKVKSPTAGKPTVKKKKRKMNKKNIATLVIGSLVCIGLIVGIVGLMMLSVFLSDKPDLNVSDFISAESSQIYDKDNNLIADIGTQIRDNITYDDLPESLIDAFVATEDSRYFQHNGFDIARFMKAGLEVLKSRSFSQGGSTFTMQLVKNTYFVDDETGKQAEKKISRKVQEIFLAMDLEQEVNKKTIFEMYLNKLNFGGTGNIRGVQKAAEFYFGKDVGELNLSESALLAGIINAPNRYNPFNHLDYATSRRNTVLYLMNRHGYISDAEYELAKTIKVEDLLRNPYVIDDSDVNLSEYQYQSYIDTVIQEVKSLTGKDPISVSMKIYTAMDPVAQAQTDKIQAGQEESLPEFADDLMEVAMISMNNQNGEIVSIGGGRNYGRGGSMLLNHATDQFKQPGSSVKPILEYALAFEKLGWATSHVVTDGPVAYKGTTKVIKNATGKYYGQIRLVDAIGNSLNTPAISTLQEVIDNMGQDAVVQYLQNMGFSRVTADNFNIQYAIGGGSFECSLVELAGAHSVVFNGGHYIKPHTVRRIEFNDGSEPIEPSYTPIEVMSEEAAYLTSKMMYQAVNGPYANYMQVTKKPYPVYGKTGTTDWGTSGLQYGIPQGAMKDKWMVTSTSQYTTAVWLGYEKAVKDKETYFTTAKSRPNLQGKINNIMNGLLNDPIKPEGVQKPEGVTTITHILGTFPYAYPIEGMDPAYLATGEIKKEFAVLVEPQSTAISEITSFEASLDNNGQLVLNWAPYPDPTKLVVADTTMNLGIDVGGTWYDAWGARLFDYTWIFGPIRYRAAIMENGEFIGEILSETENATQNIELHPGANIKVCGAYVYENLGTSSNEICQEFSVTDNELTVTFPAESATREQIQTWADGYGFKVTFREEVSTTNSGTRIMYNGQIASGGSMTIKQSQIPNISLEVIIYKAPDTPVTTPPTEVETEEQKCRADGGFWNGSKCILPTDCKDDEIFTPDKGCIAKPTEPTPTPEEKCRADGKFWTGSECVEKAQCGENEEYNPNDNTCVAKTESTV